MIISKDERNVVIAVTIGSVLEWYEIFLYVYWAPIIAKTFFEFTMPIVDLVNTLIILAIGFLSRPLGGLVFGWIGDKWGRKRSFALSIFLISLPSIAISILPSYSTWNIFSIIALGCVRFFQGIPAGGELPGAICYLSEVAATKHKKYICSYAFVGAQIGQIISMIECLLLSKYLSLESLESWGWRISFFAGGMVGLLGYYFRYKLKESPVFQKLKDHNELQNKPLLESFKKFKKKMTISCFISIFEVVGFFMIAVFPAIYFENIFNISRTKNLLINAFMLTISVLTIPYFGKLGDKYKNNIMFIISAIGVVLFSLPYYLAVYNSLFYISIIFQIILIFFLNFQFALLPSLLSSLFPPTTRYTCLGFSFNICDSLIGGTISIIAVYIINYTGNSASFIILFPISAVIFLVTFIFIEKNKKNISKKQNSVKI